MDLIKKFVRNFLYGGLLMGVILTIMDVIKTSKSLIKLYAFLTGSFFIVNVIQYQYLKNLNESLISEYLQHLIIGGIVWVGLALLLYNLHKSKLDEIRILITFLIIIILITIIYYNLLKN